MRKEFTIMAVLIAAIVGIGSCNSYYTFSNRANQFEIDIPRIYAEGKIVHSQYTNQLREIFQIPERHVEKFLEAIDRSMAGRYGPDGSDALWQWIQEQNLAVPTELYANVQDGFNKFRETMRAQQNSLNNQKAAYQVYLRATTSGRIWNVVCGYPHTNLDQYNLISSENTNNVFNTGLENDHLKLY